MFSKNAKVVYLPGGPGAIGIITGNRHGNEWEVKFGPADKRFIEEVLLQIVPDDESLVDMFSNARFSGIDDFRRVFSRIRLSGELTNLVYSMGNPRTTFFSHQFIPVLKFLSSSKNGLLIADEVGLGKTIEAMFVWQELRARDNARRLLIVAPAVLKAKWLGDIAKFFDVDAREASADTILAHINDQLSGKSLRSFACVASLHELRANDRLKSILKEYSDDKKFFDLVIIDEAHYMRNDVTESFRLGELLRDTTENLLLLSATPIQTGVDNFRNLLRLLDPVEFGNEDIFQRQLGDFAPLVRLSNALDANESAPVLRTLLNAARGSGVLAGDATLHELDEYLNLSASAGSNNAETRLRRLKLIEKLRSKFFYSEYVTRMRKKDVIEHRARRDARSIQFSLSESERQFYDAVTDYLRSKDDRQNRFQSFRLIARQRQMASCMPAALRTWRNEPLEIEERNDSAEADPEYDLYSPDSTRGGNIPMPRFDGIDLDQLEREDTKFNRFLSEIKRLLQENPKEKIVVFSFFRGTVNYLHARLANEHIRAIPLLGGLSSDEKKSRLAQFADMGGSYNVLLSTEVGSEGIDLQFARVEINYDLPWNPMRLEQRIGRIDRIGQESDVIYIYNAYCADTIEDRVLRRLHERIRTFQDVLGDLEEILGPKIQDVELEVFRSRGLTDAQVAKMLDQLETVKENQVRIAEDLHVHAGLLSEYQQYVLEGINRSRRQNRLLKGEEIRFLVTDYLNNVFPGSTVNPEREPGVFRVSLSSSARKELREFMEGSKFFLQTDLTHIDARCSFGTRPENANPGVEVVDINHALVRWMVNGLRTTTIGTGCDSISVSATAPDMPSVPEGLYSFYVQLWNTKGVIHTKELKFFVVDCKTQTLLPIDVGEQMLSSALLHGATFEPSTLTDAEWEGAHEACGIAYKTAWKEKDRHFSTQKNLDNDEKSKRLSYLDAFYKKKLAIYEASIEKRPDDLKFVQMQRGKIQKIKAEQTKKVAELSAKTTIVEPSEIAIGIVKVEGSSDGCC